MGIDFGLSGKISYLLLFQTLNKMKMTSPLKNLMIWLTNLESLIITQTYSETIENFEISSKVNVMNQKLI